MFHLDKHSGKKERKKLSRKKKGEGVVAFPFLRLSMSHAKPGEASEVVGTKDGFGCLFECQIFCHFFSIMDK